MSIWFYVGLSMTVGLIQGFLGAMFGFGGSSVASPILRLVGIAPLLALGTPLPVAIPTAIPSLYNYYKRGLVDLQTVKWVLAGAFPMMLVGAFSTRWISGHLLMMLTGLAVTAIGARAIVGNLTNPAHRDAAATAERGNGSVRSRRNTALLIGAPAGLFAGVLANGGGPLLVPAFMLFRGFTMQEAVATSLACVAALTVPGSVIHWYLGHVDLRLMLILSVGVIPASYLGSTLALRLGNDTTRRLFGGFMLAFGLFFTCHELLHYLG